MKRKKVLIISIIVVVIIVVLAVFFIMRAPSSRECEKDSDCIVFGETGDCNCGCYTQNNLPTDSGGECFCLAPVSCVCADGKCEGIFAEMSKEEAQRFLSAFDQAQKNLTPPLQQGSERGRGTYVEKDW